MRGVEMRPGMASPVNSLHYHPHPARWAVEHIWGLNVLFHLKSKQINKINK